MRNSRFIFTIDETSKQHIVNVADKYGISQSKAVKRILEEHSNRQKTKEIVTPSGNEKHSPRKKTNVNIQQIISKYSTPDLNIALSSEDVLALLSNEDIDLIIYLLNDLINKEAKTDSLMLLYAKVLKHRGFFSEAQKVLDNIEDKFNFQKYQLLLSIYISLGDIPKAKAAFMRCSELMNIYNAQLAYLKEDLDVLQAELIWIDSGVGSAHKFVRAYFNRIGNKNTPAIGKFYCLEGEFLRDKGDYRQAEIAYNKSLEYLQDRPYEGTYLARALKGLGSIYKKRGDMKKSSEMLFNALDISRRFADKITESGVLASVGSLYLAQDNRSLGIKMLQEKSDIGQRANSLREQFYAGYDLSMALIEEQDYQKARETIETHNSVGKAFKREYYLDMWRGFLESFDNQTQGLRTIQISRNDAYDAGEDKKVFLADYLLATANLRDPKNHYKGKNIIQSLVNNPQVSGQLKQNAEHLLKTKSVRSI